MNIYDNLAQQTIDLLNKVNRLYYNNSYLLYFNYKYSWQKEFTKGTVLVEIKPDNIFVFDYDIFEGQDKVVLIGVTPIDETNAEPFYKVK